MYPEDAPYHIWITRDPEKEPPIDEATQRTHLEVVPRELYDAQEMMLREIRSSRRCWIKGSSKRDVFLAKEKDKVAYLDKIYKVLKEEFDILLEENDKLLLLCGSLTSGEEYTRLCAEILGLEKNYAGLLELQELTCVQSDGYAAEAKQLTEEMQEEWKGTLALMERFDARPEETIRVFVERLVSDRDFWARTAKEYKDDYNEVIRRGPKDTIAELKELSEYRLKEIVRLGDREKELQRILADCQKSNRGLLETMSKERMLGENLQLTEALRVANVWVERLEDIAQRVVVRPVTDCFAFVVDDARCILEEMKDD